MITLQERGITAMVTELGAEVDSSVFFKPFVIDNMPDSIVNASQ